MPREIATQYPVTGEVLKRFDPHTEEEIEFRLAQADSTAKKWRDVSFADRAKLMTKLGALFEERAEEYAKIMAYDMGKPLKDGIGEAKKCAWFCRHYAEHAEEYLKDVDYPSDASHSYITYVPMGAVLAVMPWNYPFFQVMRFAAPAAMAGNVIVLKHASNVPQCAIALEQAFRDAGFPDGVLTQLLIAGSRASQLVDDPRIAAVTLTGSNRSGEAVAERAGRNVKKCVLELGGSDAFVVLDDADLDLAVDLGVTGRCVNSGQSCIAAKRFIVDKSVIDDFTAKFTEKIAQKKVGDPLDKETDIGPIARADLRAELHDHVTAAVEGGAKIELGGVIPDGPGYFYPPTVLTGVQPGNRVFEEETFGPVAAIIPADNAEHAIELANMSKYGLGGAIITRDIARGRELARKMESGITMINGFTKSDARLPFGGVKKSGYGRECSHQGMIEFMNLKTVWIG